MGKHAYLWDNCGPTLTTSGCRPQTRIPANTCRQRNRESTTKGSVSDALLTGEYAGLELLCPAQQARVVGDSCCSSLSLSRVFKEQNPKLIILDKSKENGTPVFFCQFSVRKIETRKSGYPKPKVNIVFCQGKPFSGKISMSVRPNRKNKKKTVHKCVFASLRYTKIKNEAIRAHQTQVR